VQRNSAYPRHRPGLFRCQVGDKEVSCMIDGISHLTFTVKDLERATVFFRYIFDAEEVYSSGEKTFSLSREKFLLINGLWICIMEGESLSDRTYNHVAFKIQDEEYDAYESRIEALGVDFRPPRPRVAGEGRSIYFYDFDNHLFEIHTGTLSERLARYSR
jgi:catechol 2,3-dioxygenase-like lactoylglutathione lyase family enzyme